MPLIDVVNFNADASCLSSAKWLRCLEGGRESLLMQVLDSYVRANRKVNLGPMGATVCDIAAFNPEAIDLINEHPDIFEIVLRPFAHDNALLRLPAGFRCNVEAGIETIRRRFRRTTNFFLAPEVMVTSEQIRILHELGVTAVFLHKGRYDLSVSRHVPDEPFELYGVFSTPMVCIPFTAKTLELKYLAGVHGTVSADEWAQAAFEASADLPLAIWRDGESSLLHPLGERHEAAMLLAEKNRGVRRMFLSELDTSKRAGSLPDGTIRYFPLHSMKPWLNDMKMYWYVDRVRRIEETLSSLSEPAKRLWLLVINSDILSAAEKSPPVVDVSDAVYAASRDDLLWDGVIAVPEQKRLILSRSERAGEGEDYLAYLELAISSDWSAGELCDRWRDAAEPHLRKAHARVCRSITP